MVLAKAWCSIAIREAWFLSSETIDLNPDNEAVLKWQQECFFVSVGRI